MIDDGLTDAEKIEQLWKRLDQAESDKESLRFLGERKDDQITQLRAQVDGLSLANHGLREQVTTVVRELNAARSAAAAAVQDYIAAKR